MSDIQVTDEHNWFYHMMNEVHELIAKGAIFPPKAVPPDAPPPDPKAPDDATPNETPAT